MRLEMAAACAGHSGISQAIISRQRWTGANSLFRRQLPVAHRLAAGERMVGRTQ